jgi:hypothetical protein
MQKVLDPIPDTKNKIKQKIKLKKKAAHALS